VERKIRFLRDRFLAGREILSIEQGNRELLAFCRKNCSHHAPPGLRQEIHRGLLGREKERLLRGARSLPATDLVMPVAIDKTAFAHFDTNLYSVPPDVVQQTLTLVADDRRVRILRGQTVVAEHGRSFGQRQKVEVLGIAAEIIQRKRGADSSTGATVCGQRRPTSISWSDAGSKLAATSGSWWPKPDGSSTSTGRTSS